MHTQLMDRKRLRAEYARVMESITTMQVSTGSRQNERRW